MALYYFKGKNFNGEEVSGILNTENKYSVARRIKSQGLVPVKIKEINVNSLSYMITVFFRRVSSKDMAVFCKQFGVMLEAGMNVLDSLNFIAKQTQDNNFRSILTDISWQIKGGYSLSDALKNYPYVFSEVFVSMIEAGEASGNLNDILKMLYSYYSDISMRKEKIKSALTYPILLGIVSFAVVNFLTINVLPVYVNIFASHGVTLPKLTQMLMWLNSHLTHIFFFSLVFFLVSCLIILRCIKSEKLAFKLDELKLSFPIVGQIIKKHESSKVVRVLSILVASGIPLLKAIDICANTVKNRFILREMEKIKWGLRKGDNLSNLLSCNVFLPIVVKMIAIGEETGTLEEMLDKVATIYEKDIEIVLERLISLVEPVIILLLTIVISFIVISIIMPMFEIYNFL